MDQDKIPSVNRRRILEAGVRDMHPANPRQRAAGAGHLASPPGLVWYSQRFIALFTENNELFKLPKENPSPVSPNPYRVLREGEKLRAQCHCVGTLLNPSPNKIPSHLVTLIRVLSRGQGDRHCTEPGEVSNKKKGRAF